MSIQNELMKELALTAKEGSTARRNNIKFIIGLFQNASKNKEKTVDDTEAIKIIKNILKSVKEVTIPNILKTKDKGSSDYSESCDFVELCESILPQEASEEDIRNFLKTVDFSGLKNKMQAVGLVNKHFNGNVDGNLAKNIVMDM